MTETSRLDAEWITLNAFRGATKIAAKGDVSKSTYENALELGGALYPAMLGPESSILRRMRESETTTEYRQRASVRSLKENMVVAPLELVRIDIQDIQDLLEIAKTSKDSKEKVDKLKKRLGVLRGVESELNPMPHTENQLIFRDALNVDRIVPSPGSGQGYRDFQLPDSNILRVRVLHPDKPEHVTGADIIYERHSPHAEAASIVAVQYKIWERRSMYLTDARMLSQLDKLRRFTCDKTLCDQSGGASAYRFPCCAAFLRPTDKLQNQNQAFISSGQHLPICKIAECTTAGERGAPLLEYKGIRDVALSSEMFEGLFNTGKIGSRELTYDELTELYMDYQVAADEGAVVIYIQEFLDNG
ncbi:hypothetical protein [Burkholderia ubonensis]|uniref:hypothetical protein n=1 Tax=Burkholderia ubonensis TaxID=101571 RepID=UPI0007541C10|nr:hypothetical protein [Burkholderia ubonensis]KWB43022.1 hypothetical protein WL36_21950 [Burkholderia ubonensis]